MVEEGLLMREWLSKVRRGCSGAEGGHHITKVLKPVHTSAVSSVYVSIGLEEGMGGRRGKIKSVKETGWEGSYDTS